MTVRTTILIAIAAAIAVVSVAAAGPASTKQRVQIDMTHPGNAFVLIPLQAGAIQRDSGTESCAGESKREVVRDGQQAWIWTCQAWRFTGKHGTLVLRSQYTWIEAGGPYNIATGTWKVVSGTGQYAHVVGGGRNAHVGTVRMARARYQGFLISR